MLVARPAAWFCRRGPLTAATYEGGLGLNLALSNGHGRPVCIVADATLQRGLGDAASAGGIAKKIAVRSGFLTSRRHSASRAYSFAA